MTTMNSAASMHTVGLNECVVSDDPNVLLVTYALGSCIAVVAWDRIQCVGGMIHFSLPLSSINPEKAAILPTMFGDTGVPILFRSLYEIGAQKRNLVVKIAGAARLHTVHTNSVMDIGSRNYVVVRKMLWKNNIFISAEDVGGSKSRTVRLWIRDGAVTVSSKGVETAL